MGDQEMNQPPAMQSVGPNMQNTSVPEGYISFEDARQMMTEALRERERGVRSEALALALLFFEKVTGNTATTTELVVQTANEFAKFLRGT